MAADRLLRQSFWRWRIEGARVADDYRNALPIGGSLDGRYVITDVLGAGGFGVVYRATHQHLGTEHAIKEYLPIEVSHREGATVHPLNTQVAADFEDGLRRFVQEARKLVGFGSHPNIVRCTDFFQANGTAYLVMAFEEGMSLAELMAHRESQGRSLDESEIIRILLRLLEGLGVVHAQNVLHRDIKPGNIFVRRQDEQPVMLDFGAAKEDFTKHSKSRAPYTPGYAAPEQVEDDEGLLGPWTDMYALGAVAWRMAAGKVPPKVESRMMARVKGRSDPLESLGEEQGVSGRLAAFIDRCMRLDERDRVQSAAEALALLARDQSNEACGESTLLSGGVVTSPGPERSIPHTTVKSAAAAPYVAERVNLGNQTSSDVANARQRPTTPALSRSAASLLFVALPAAFLLWPKEESWAMNITFWAGVLLVASWTLAGRVDPDRHVRMLALLTLSLPLLNSLPSEIGVGSNMVTFQGEFWALLFHQNPQPWWISGLRPRWALALMIYMALAMLVPWMIWLKLETRSTIQEILSRPFTKTEVLVVSGSFLLWCVLLGGGIFRQADRLLSSVSLLLVLALLAYAFLIWRLANRLVRFRRAVFLLALVLAAITMLLLSAKFDGLIGGLLPSLSPLFLAMWTADVGARSKLMNRTATRRSSTWG